MAVQLNNDGLAFTGLDETGFEPPNCPGVTLRPLLLMDDGKAINVFYATIEPGKEITRETHPFSETLVVIDGELTCSIEDGDAVAIGPGRVWHTPANTWHLVRNNGTRLAQFTLLGGI
jgi:quercetin dioxygenase-like cupin family protein